MRPVETWTDRSKYAPLIVPKALSFEVDSRRVVVIYHNQDGSRVGNIVGAVDVRPGVGAVSFNYPRSKTTERSLEAIQIGDDLVVQKDGDLIAGFDVYRMGRYFTARQLEELGMFPAIPIGRRFRDNG